MRTILRPRYAFVCIWGRRIVHDNNPDSDRVMLSRRAAFQALNELAKEKQFSSITAGDIIGHAGISRSTFYRYFSDKYDLVNWSYRYYLNIHPAEAEKYHSYETGLMAHLVHVRDFRACYASALRFKQPKQNTPCVPL